ncbi:MAG TPA: hypothetical protein G4O10_08595 [Dehalococcoidia bacterium]|nr:hypothetical protein [Dehalococcoidia bacterium]
MSGKKGRSGRKKHDKVMAGVQQTIDTTATQAASYLLDVFRGQIKNPDWKRIEIAKFVIEHHLGKPKQKITLPTDSQGRTIIPYSKIIMLAEQANKTPDTPESRGVSYTNLLPPVDSKDG